jgi:hypothetical protein
MVQINNLNFKNEELIDSIRAICAIHNTIAQLSLSTYIYIYM